MRRPALRVKDHEVLAVLARNKGFGPARLARYCRHDSHSFMSRLLRGQPGTNYVTPETGRYIAEALDVPVSVLFEDRDVKSPDSTRAAA